MRTLCKKLRLGFVQYCRTGQAIGRFAADSQCEERLSLQAGQKGGSLYGILQVKTVIFTVP
jgi:hypothetical protein